MLVLYGFIEFLHRAFCRKEQSLWLLQAAGVPTVPGSDGLVRNPDEAFRVAKEVTPDSSRCCMLQQALLPSTSQLHRHCCKPR